MNNLRAVTNDTESSSGSRRAPTRVLSLIGTRPEGIKMAPVICELERHPDFESKICLTAQHRDMVDRIVSLFGLDIDYDLDVMRAGQSLTDVTTKVLEGLAPIVEEGKPDWILVQGDTTTAMAGSLSAFYHGVRVGHVEAGLRTWNKAHPFPEEINRKMAAVLADLHFAPTEWAAANLAAEGVPMDQVFVSGNTVIDALRLAADIPFDPTGTELEHLPIDEKRIVLVTAHRRENFGKGIDEICAGIRMAAHQTKDAHFVCPVHLNPAAQRMHELLDSVPNVSLISPLDYLPMVWLLERCSIVVTDSGGLQEEATGFGKPVLVLRETTERPEGVQAGTAKLVGAQGGRLCYWICHLLDDEEAYARMSQAHSPYGEGDSAERIIEVLSGSHEILPASEDLEEQAEDRVAESDSDNGRMRRSDPPWLRDQVLRLRA